MNPAIVVLSYGALKPTDIVNDLIELNEGTTTTKEISFGSENVTTYPYINKTKYYTNDLMLLPYEGEVDALPTELLKITEGLIVYFDGQNKSFLEELPALRSLMENNNIELGLFLTNELCDDSASGLTYKQVKSASKMLFDIIELKPESDGEDNEAASSTVHAYSEVHYAIQNNIWSNVEHPKLKSIQNGDSNQSWDSMEDQLELFEELLVSLQNFKKISSSLEREEVLNHAEKFAELFTNIINEDLE